VVTERPFLERPAIIPIGEWVLEGLWHRGDSRPPLLIVPPPPEQGSMDHPVLAEIAWAAARAGFPTLRFNFRGAGASQGKRGGDQERLADAEAALRVLEENAGVARVAVFSLGGSAPAIIELQRLHPGVVGLCFVSPARINSPDLSRSGVPLLAIVGEGDLSVAPAALAAAISEAGGRMEIIRGADAQFHSGLSEAGKSVVRWLAELGDV